MIGALRINPYSAMKISDLCLWNETLTRAPVISFVFHRFHSCFHMWYINGLAYHYRKSHDMWLSCDSESCYKPLFASHTYKKKQQPKTPRALSHMWACRKECKCLPVVHSYYWKLGWQRNLFDQIGARPKRPWKTEGGKFDCDFRSFHWLALNADK